MCASTKRKGEKEETGWEHNKILSISFNTCGKRGGHTAGRFIRPMLAMVVVFQDIIAFTFSRIFFFYNIEGIVIRNSPTSFFFSLSYFGFFCRLILLNCLAFYFSTLDLYLTWVRLTLYIQDACIGGELFCMRCIAGEEKKRQACWDTFFKKIPAPSWGWLNPTCFFRRDPDAND